MSLEEEIAVNRFGQGVGLIENLLHPFLQWNQEQKRTHLKELSFLIWQSKPIDADIEKAIIESSLKETFTPCVILKIHRLKVGLNQIVNLPVDELGKVYRLMLFLFKQAYQRRFKEEYGAPNKWWYWDLSKAEIVQRVLLKK